MNKNSEKVVLIGICIGYCVLLSSYAGYFPIWDAWANAGTWITGAVNKPFSIFNFDHGGHPSMVYFFLLGLSQYISPNNMFLMHVCNMVLSVFSILAFYRIMKFLVPQRQFLFERSSFTFLYAFFPILVGNSLHINPDYGVLVFFVISLSFLLHDRLYLAALSGIGLVFSKEPGIVVYTGLIGLYFLFFVPKRRFIPEVSALGGTSILIVPLLIFASVMLYKTYFLHLPGMWIGILGAIGEKLTTPATYRANWSSWDSTKIPLSYALGIFVINFNWILSTVILFSLVKIALFKKENKKMGVFFLLLFAGICLVVTYVKTFSNLRYFLPLYPVLIILFALATISFPIKSVRRIFLCLICILFFITNFRTVDPVSKRIYGTFPFGKHELLKMTSITGECCGYGRDQIVYNLEYTPISFLTEEILTYIKINPDTPISFHTLGGGNIMEIRIDPLTHKRTLSLENMFMPKVVAWSFFDYGERPEVVYFIDYPISDSKEVVASYLIDYDVGEKKVFDRDGYTMTLYRFVKKKA